MKPNFFIFSLFIIFRHFSLLIFSFFVFFKFIIVVVLDGHSTGCLCRQHQNINGAHMCRVTWSKTPGDSGTPGSPRALTGVSARGLEKWAPARETWDKCEKRKNDAYASLLQKKKTSHAQLKKYCPDFFVGTAPGGRVHHPPFHKKILKISSKSFHWLSHESAGDCQNKGLIEIMSQISREAGTAHRMWRNSSRSLRRRRMQRTSQHDQEACRCMITRTSTTLSMFTPVATRTTLFKNCTCESPGHTVDELDLKHLHFGLDPCEQLDPARPARPAPPTKKKRSAALAPPPPPPPRYPLSPRRC